jgi:hypothetical protein
MKIRFLFLLFLACFTSHLKAQGDESAIEKALYNLPDIQFKKYSKPGDTYL